jgi:tellurite methyltransferase
MAQRGLSGIAHSDWNLDMLSWNERYRRGEHTGETPHPLIFEYAAKLLPGRALDLACGLGRHALHLAECGWQVTAVDSSQIALEILRERARDRGVNVEARLADLERGEFIIEAGAYDLIVVTCYLQRDLFPAIKAGLRIGGVALLVIAVVDDDPAVKPMNPAFLLQPGELRAQFDGWRLLHDCEGKSGAGRRTMAGIVAESISPLTAIASTPPRSIAPASDYPAD